MRLRKIIAVFLIICCSLIVGTPALAHNAPSTSQQPITITRLSGQTRFETAKAISEQYNQGKVQNVILSTGNGFADALSASVLAHKKEAPILLVDTSIDGSQNAFDYVTQYLEPNGTIFIIGGTGIIDEEFESKLNNIGFSNIIRIAGNDRYETSYELATVLNSSASTVVISSGESYPDALSIASFAANKGWPILLTPQASLPQEMSDFLKEKKPSKVYITGGTGVISDSVKSEIIGILPQASVERLAGQDRFDTNASIVQTFRPNPSTVYLATGYGFADALAGSVLAAKDGNPIIFIDPSAQTLPKSIASYFGKLYSGKQSPSLVVFGGNGVVKDELLKNLSDLISGTVKEDSIYSINDIMASVTQNESYTLPATVNAKLYNSDTINVPVKWTPSTVDTSKIGSSVYTGVVDEFSKTIKLTLITNLRQMLPPEEFKAKMAYEANNNAVSSNFTRWGRTIISYLQINNDKTISVIEAKNKVVAIETYDEQYNLIDSKSIENELPIFGAFYSGENYNYIVFGQGNHEEDNNKEVIRIVRYDKSFKRVDSVSIKGGESNTIEPFDAGSGKMSEHGNTLVFHTSHLRYTTVDGSNHQSELTIIVNTQTMTVTNALGRFQGNYVSHSFDQYVLFDGNRHVLIDHGDAHPRSIVLNKENGETYDEVDLFKIPGKIGANCTGVSVGGFEISSEDYIVAMNTIDHSLVSEYNSFNMVGLKIDQRDIILCTLPRNNVQASMVKQITVAKYIGSDKLASIPQLVKISDEMLMVMWQEYDNKHVIGALKYVLVDKNGNTIGEIQTINNFKLSRCKPLFAMNKIIWYVNENGIRTFYSIPL